MCIYIIWCVYTYITYIYILCIYIYIYVCIYIVPGSGAAGGRGPELGEGASLGPP